MQSLSEVLQNRPVWYVTRDIERALGLSSEYEGFFIISNATSFAKQVAAGRNNILLIDAGRLLDTWELLEHTHASSHTKASGEGDVEKEKLIVVFKNTPQIERICLKQNWKLLNPPAALSSQIEEKISQVEWLGELARYLPPHTIAICKDVAWHDEPFILQFNRAHTGSGTFLIASEEQLADIQKKFPDRPVRVTQYIDGPMFTNNNVVTHTHVVTGPTNCQITGLAPFTDNVFATVGNDWGVVAKLLSVEQQRAYTEIAQAVGEKLRAQGWRGAFGIDVALETATGKLYLIEINARQPASLTFESHLQQRFVESVQDDKRMNSFELHIAALLGLNIEQTEAISVNDGAQVVVRKCDERGGMLRSKQMVAESLQKQGLTVIEYDNEKAGSDLLRIQSNQSLMQAYNQWSELGQRIVDTLYENTLSTGA